MKKSLVLLPLLAWPHLVQAQDTPETPKTSAPITAPATVPATAPDAETTRQATVAYNAGLAALKKNDWMSAANNFGRAAALTPNDAGALSFLGYVRLQQRRYDDALTALLAAREVGNTLDAKAQAQLQNNIGFAYWNKGEFPEAKVAFDKALELDKDYFDARYNLAFALLAREQWADALPHLKQLGEQNPKDAAIQDGLGEAFENTENLPSALGAYSRATRLEPKNAAYRFKLALALVRSDRREDALRVLRETLAINQNYAPAYLQIGDLHLKSNRWNEAQFALERYVNLRGNDFVGRFNLGVAYDYDSEFAKALEQYAEAEKLKSDDAATKNNVGRIHYKQGRLPEAVAKFNEALKIDPNFADARTNLAIVLAAQGKFDDSNEQWKALVANLEDQIRNTKDAAEKKALFARLATARSGIAGNFLADNQFADAAQEYRRLLTISPGDLDAYSGLGRAYYQIPNYPEAEKAYREILKRDPQNANALNDLGVTLEARKDRPGAIESYNAALKADPKHSEARNNLQRLTGNLPAA